MQCALLLSPESWIIGPSPQFPFYEGEEKELGEEAVATVRSRQPLVRLERGLMRDYRIFFPGLAKVVVLASATELFVVLTSQCLFPHHYPPARVQQRSAPEVAQEQQEIQNIKNALCARALLMTPIGSPASVTLDYAVTVFG